jgi:hypothetical protein
MLKKIFIVILFIYLSFDISSQVQLSLSGNRMSVENNNINLSTIECINSNNPGEFLDSIIVIFSSGFRKKLTYYYNNDFSLHYFTFANSWDNDEWIILDRNINTYSSNGNLELILWESLNDSGEWYNSAKDIFTYDSLNNKTVHLFQIFNGQVLINHVRTEYWYTTTNNITSSLTQSWDGHWVNSNKTINYYNNLNLKDSSLLQIWEGEQWVNYQLNHYEYDENFKVIKNQVKRRQGDDLSDFARGFLKYDVNNNCELETWELYSNNNWENWFRKLYEYNNKNLIHQYGEDWINNQWVPSDGGLMITNPDGVMHGFLAKEMFLYYSKLSGVEKEDNIVDNYFLLQNYPNPFNPLTNIRFALPEDADVKLTIYDILGREVSTLVNEFRSKGYYNVTFDGSKLSSGVYIYKLEANDKVFTKKLMLMK